MQSLLNIIDRIERIKKNDEDPTAIKCDIEILNKILNGGFSKGNLYVVAGKESVGKTSFIVSLISDIIHNRTDSLRVGVITINTSEELFIAKVLSNLTGVMLESILRGKLIEHDKQRLNHFTNTDEFDKIEITAPGYLSIQELIDTCSGWVAEKNVEIIFIDYLQLISIEGIHENDLKLFSLCKALKKLSTDLNIPIIVTVPISVGKKVSDLKDLRKMGAIEPFADVIMFLNKEFYNRDPVIEKSKQEIILSIPKNNTGLLDNIKSRTALHVQKFVEFDY